MPTATSAIRAICPNSDPAYRRALEALALPYPPRNEQALWRDAGTLAYADGATAIGARHLRGALSLQLAVAAAIEAEGAVAYTRQPASVEQRAAL